MGLVTNMTTEATRSLILYPKLYQYSFLLPSNTVTISLKVSNALKKKKKRGREMGGQCAGFKHCGSVQSYPTPLTLF